MMFPGYAPVLGPVRAAAPLIETPRLRLRGHVASDLAAFRAFYLSGHSFFVGAPDTATKFWYGFASELGSRALTGYGSWAVETRDGVLVGQVTIGQPPHFPELEIGWILLDGFEGRGFAFEAAHAARSWAWDTLPATTLVSYITPGNARSIALAQRLGAVHDPDACLPDGETPEETVVYRHSPDDDGSPEAYA